ncbi:MAG: hypothetical protein GF364_05380, partial [Candidatus Lokiarchaeota archaeon]|nr:hypothetical protein [Candidatus Lokiarchaeota archaeon]
FIAPQAHLAKDQPKESLNTRVVTFGDIQPRKLIPPIFQFRLLKKVRDSKPDLILYLGDHTMHGINPFQWRWFYHIHGKLIRNVPILGIPGNHDLKIDKQNKNLIGENAYRTYVNYPNNKRSYGIHIYGLHVIAFDWGKSFNLRSQQYDFLKTQLNPYIERDDKVEKNDTEWLICMWHSSPYNTVRKNNNVLDMIHNIVPLVRKAGGKLWLGGHEHSYQHFVVDRVHYITSGATSSFHKHWINIKYMRKLVMKMHFVLLDIKRKKISVKAISCRGNIIDSFIINQDR